MSDIRFNSILTPPVQSSVRQNEKVQAKTPKTSFSDYLNQAISETSDVTFSKHALTRLESRNIELNDGDLRKLTDAINQAQSKGVQDSLILMNGLAFIVSIRDRTVVTAMPLGDTSSNIFTNIDGTVIV